MPRFYSRESLKLFCNKLMWLNSEIFSEEEKTIRTQIRLNSKVDRTSHPAT